MQFRGNRRCSRVVSSIEVCHAGRMLRQSLTDYWRRPRGNRAVVWVTCLALVSACFGGQSGGETDNEAKWPDAPAACACIAVGERPVRAKVTSLAGGCAELVVLDQLVAPLAGEHMPLTVGDTFGGLLRPLCNGGAEVREGDEVLALFTRGTQDSVTCSEYRACSRERCGAPTEATTTVESECAERQAQNPTVDCETIHVSDQDALAAYDRCDTECLEETREACAARIDETWLGGDVSVARWQDGEVLFFWACEQR